MLKIVMTKSIAHQSQASPGNSQSKMSGGSPKEKKTSRFPFLSSKVDAPLSRGVIAVAMPSVMLASSVPMPAAPSFIPAPAIQPVSISPGIFPENVSRRESAIQLPKIADHIEDTSQLVFCCSLLTKAAAAAEMSLSLPSSSSAPSILNPAQLEWTQEMESHPLEKEYLHQLIDSMINKFIQHPSKNSESIREIILLGPVLDKEQYRSLLNCFLGEFKRDTILDVELLQGLVQLVQDASVDFLKADDLTQILRVIRTRQQDQKVDEYLFHLTLAVSNVLNSMVDDKVTGLNRVQEHEPLLKLLSSLRQRADPFLKYQSLYAFQALQWVPNDETNLHSGLRHFAGVVGGLIKISGVVQLDFQGLQDIQKTIKEMHEILKSGWEEIPALIESGKGVFDSVREGLGSGHKHPWYIALRAAEALVCKGQLADLNELISKAPYCQDPLFQWGICQLLGEIAVNPIWERDTRGQAIKFLGEMYNSNVGSKQHQDVRRWILTILQQILSIPDVNPFTVSNSSLKTDGESVRTQAQVLLEDLEKDDIKPFPHLYLFRKRLPLPRSSVLLKDIIDNPDLELVLDRLRRQRWNGYSKQAVYIQPLSKASLQASEDNLISLHTRVHNFLEGRAEVMLILGDSGAGKSTFNSRLEYELWDKYEPTGPIPLFVDLKAIDNPDKDMLQQQLDDLNVFSPGHIDELRRSRQFILICDGYDEHRNWSNLHTNNNFNKPSHWKTKMIITCRTQYLNPNYRSYLEPQMSHSDSYNLYEEAVIAPFKPEQIEEYVHQYITSPEAQEAFGDKPVWTADVYMARLRGVTHLMDLVKNPFLLKMVLDTLPKIAAATTQMTRAELYDVFVELHFENEQERLISQRSRNTMEADCLAVFREIEGEDFIDLGIDFSKRLSGMIFKEQGGVNSIEFSAASNNDLWKTEFFGSDAITRLLRESSQLVCRANVQQESRRLVYSRSRQTSKRNLYEFSHRSILEYFYSRLIYDPSGNPSCLDLSTCLASTAIPSPIVSHPLGQRNLVSEPSIIHFLAERVQLSEVFKGHLSAIIHLSKTDHQVSHAAANAITILVQAGVRFSGQDLRGIQVLGADLSFGIFDHADLQGANLRKTCLQGAWLRHANLTKAHMDGVWFGEWPALGDEIEGTFGYSPDGCAFLACTEQGSIHLYNTLTWSISAILEGHVMPVRYLRFSPDGTMVATGGDDNAVRLWDLKTGECQHALEGHEMKITGLAFSPCGKQLASCSKDGTVRLWAVQTGRLENIIDVPDAWASSFMKSFVEDTGPLLKDWRYKHEMRSTISMYRPELKSWMAKLGLSGVAYSPDGKALATCFLQQSVRLWSLETSEWLYDLWESPLAVKDPEYMKWSQAVNGMAFSIEGRRRQILSSGFEGSVIAWDTTTGDRQWKTELHSHILSLSYSPNGVQVACACEDGTVSLLDSMTGDTSYILQGHIGSIHQAIYSLDGLWIVTAGEDKTVRLWEAQRATPGPVLKGHSETVQRVTFSPNGFQIASGGGIDRKIRLWDIQPSTILHQQHQFSSRHTGAVEKSLFLPGGHRIASQSRNSICIWDRYTGKLCHVFEVPEHKFQTMDISPDGLEITTTAQDSDDLRYGRLKMWDVQTGVSNAESHGHIFCMDKVVCSSDGLRMACVSANEVIQIWNRQTGKLEKTFSASKDHGILSMLCFSPSESRQLAVVGHWRVITLWDMETHKCQHRFETPFNPTTIDYSPDGKIFWVYSQKANTIQSWDTTTGSSIKTIKIEPVISTVLSHYGSKLVACAQYDQCPRVMVFDVMMGKHLWVIGDATKDMLVDLTANGQFLVTCTDGNVVRVLDLLNSRQMVEIVKLEGDTAINTLCWDKTKPTITTTVAAQGRGIGEEGEGLSHELVIGRADGDISVWKLITQNEYRPASSPPNEPITINDNQKKQQMKMQKKGEGEQEHEEVTNYKLVLQWTSAFGKLNAQGTLIQHIQGLSPANARLLVQNGAEDQPLMPLVIDAT
ncbi:hypothetical protein BGZ83_008991 [Gryganskiella cystojenkinii]|nr:hypothetical protein BGZ83_008991 [Gryganskiella cystojenkinii]